jgi:hypothetical protein
VIAAGGGEVEADPDLEALASRAREEQALIKAQQARVSAIAAVDRARARSA